MNDYPRVILQTVVPRKSMEPVIVTRRLVRSGDNWLSFQHVDRSWRHNPLEQVPMERLHSAIRRFLTSESDFTQFDREFMDAWMALPDDEPPPAETDRWDEVYELVYMGAADPVHAEDRKVGVIGEAELRAQLALLYADMLGR